MPLVTFSKLSKFYGARDIVEEADWAIEPGRRIGLIGANGAGKTTLFKLMLGEEEPSSGSVSRQKGVTLGHLSQHPDFTPGHSLRQETMTAKPELLRIEEAMAEAEHQMADPAVAADAAKLEKVMERYGNLQGQFAALDGYAYEAQVEGVMQGMRFTKADFDRSVDTLSGGEKTRLMLAKLLITKPDLLLLDEPTNHLDTGMCEWLEDFLSHYDGSMVCISHDRYFLDHVVTEIAELKDCRLTLYPGNYSQYKDSKEKEQELVAKAHAEQKAFIAKTQDFIARNIAGQNTKQAQSRRKMLEKLERVEGPERKGKRLSLEINAKSSSGKEVAKFSGLSKSFGERTLFSDFEAILYRQERVGLIGPNGAGKTTLLKVLAKREEPSSGAAELGIGVDMGYYDQFQHFADPKRTVMDELWALLPSEGQQTIRGVGGRFLFSGTDIEKKISSLSGGERARLLLAKLMIQGPNFLVMDEPTNHLDIASREVVESALDEFEGTLLTVSHDRYFLDRECDHIWEIADGKVTCYEGNYTAYLDEKKKRSTLSAATVGAGLVPARRKPAPETPTPSQSEREDRKEEKARVAQLERRQADLEAQIAKLEKDKKELEDAFLDPTFANNPKGLLALKQRYDNVKEELDQVFDKWQELEERKSAT